MMREKVRNQPIGLRRGYAQLEDSPGGQEFRPGPVGLETRIVELDQGIARLVLIGDGRSAFTGTDIIIQIDGLVMIHA